MRKLMTGKLQQTLAAIERMNLETIGRQTGFVQRSARKLDTQVFVQAWLGLAVTGALTLTEIIGGMRLLGHAEYSKQALAKRLHHSAEAFFTAILLELLVVQTRSQALQGYFSSFNRVLIQDSTTVTLPDRYAAVFPASGNQSRRRLAQLKIQFILDLAGSRLCQFSLSGFTRNDQAAAADILTIIRHNDLVLRDLGYFSLSAIERILAANAHLLSRLHPSVKLYDSTTAQEPLDLYALLSKHLSLDRTVWVGKERIPLRLVAQRTPKAVGDKRRREAYRDSRNRPTQDRLRLMDWNLFLTDVPGAIWPTTVILDIYGLRWKIEIVFKAWKSGLHLARLNTHTESMLRLSVLAQLLLCAVTLSFCAQLTALTSGPPYVSILRVARLISRFAALITCVLFNYTPAQLLSELLRQHSFYEIRPDRRNMSQRFATLSEKKLG